MLCKQCMKSVPSSVSNAAFPIRVMILIQATTYGESVSCIPIFDKFEPIGPMLNGITYIVLPTNNKLLKVNCYFIKEL